jgi:hypothetical protein
VLRVDEVVSEEGQIEKPQPELVRKEPLHVAGDFEFVTMDLTDDTQVSPNLTSLTPRYKKSMNCYRVTTSKTTTQASASPTPPRSLNGTPPPVARKD